MKKLFVYLSLVMLVSILTSSDIPVGEVQYKCMIQIKNYKGEGAYVIVSLINPKGDYEKTLYVIGDDSDGDVGLSSGGPLCGKKRPQ